MDASDAPDSAGWQHRWPAWRTRRRCLTVINATVREYEQTTVTMSLALAHRLDDAAGSALRVELGEGEGRWVLRANSQVGTIRVGDDIEVKITPKVAIAMNRPGSGRHSGVPLVSWSPVSGFCHAAVFVRDRFSNSMGVIMPSDE